MSSTSSTPLGHGSKLAAHAERLCPWPVNVCVLLIVVTMIGAVGLRTASLRLGCENRGPFRAAPALVVDLNTAPPQVVGALPHIGGVLVKRIVEQRTIRPFQSIDDLRHRVRGLGPATMARLAPHLRIGPRESYNPRLATVPRRRTVARELDDSSLR
jgi:competence protein ComEA